MIQSKASSTMDDVMFLWRVDDNVFKRICTAGLKSIAELSLDNVEPSSVFAAPMNFSLLGSK